MPDTDALQNKRFKVLETLNWYERKIDGRFIEAKNKIIEIALCYEGAFRRHKDFIKAGEAYEQQMANIGFVILTAVTAGSLSVLSSMAQDARKAAQAAKQAQGWKGILGIEGLEDTVQTGVSNGLMLVPGKIDFYRNTKPIPTPMTFQNETTYVLNKQQKQVNAYLNNLRRELIDKELSSYRKFHQTEFEIRLERAVKHLRPLPKIDSVAMEKEIEIGFWAHWVPGGVKHWVPPYEVHSCFGGGGMRPGYFDYDSIPKPVYEHLKKLLPASSGIHMGWWQFQSELKKVEAWAANWKPSQTFPPASDLTAVK